jgi:DNA-binding NarL/FixJ family response regulator
MLKIDRRHVRTAAKVVRVAICDDNPDIRELVEAVIEDDPRLELIGEAADGRSGLAVVCDRRPDVLLLDMELPDCSGLEILPLVRERCPACRVVVYTSLFAASIRERALELGAERVLSKRARLAELVGAMLGR